MKLYVGNLSFSTTEETLQAEFGAHGQVEEVAVITDRDTGRPRGFAFVSMNNDNEARAATPSMKLVPRAIAAVAAVAAVAVAVIVVAAAAAVEVAAAAAGSAGNRRGSQTPHFPRNRCIANLAFAIEMARWRAAAASAGFVLRTFHCRVAC
jgi:hypothetical protein